MAEIRSEDVGRPYSLQCLHRRTASGWFWFMITPETWLEARGCLAQISVFIFHNLPSSHVAFLSLSLTCTLDTGLNKACVG